MKTIPKIGLITLLAIGLCIGFIIATETVIYKMIGEEGVKYMEQNHETN